MSIIRSWDPSLTEQLIELIMAGKTDRMIAEG